MIKIDSKNLGYNNLDFDKKYKALIDDSMFGLNEKYKSGQLGFIDVDLTVDTVEINNFVEKNKDFFDSVVILGIGGSALGVRAIHTALKGKYFNQLSKNQREGYLKLHILDNVDPYEISDLEKVISYKKTLFIVISKSGKTLETISQFQFFKSKIEENNLDFKKHFLVIAGENSKFKQESLKKGLNVFDIPDNVGGRFSVFTNVGLLPLAFCGINIDELLKGVSLSKKSYLNNDLAKNPALLIAIIQYYSYIELHNNITILFPYISNFKFVGEWYNQLIAESLGKGSKGITLSNSIGVTDQHSQLQLYSDGPNDKLITFIELENFRKDYDIPFNNNLKFSDLMKVENYGTKESITNSKKLNYSIILETLDEKSIGELFLLFEFQISILGELYGINAFDQPGVENGKQIASKKIKEDIGDIDILKGIIN